MKEPRLSKTSPREPVVGANRCGVENRITPEQILRWMAEPPVRESG